MSRVLWALSLKPMKQFPRITQWFGAALEAYKLQNRKSHVDPAVTLAIHQACEKGFHAISGLESEKEDAITAALQGDPLQEVVLLGYASTMHRTVLMNRYVP